MLYLFGIAYLPFIFALRSMNLDHPYNYPLTPVFAVGGVRVRRLLRVEEQ